MNQNHSIKYLKTLSPDFYQTITEYTAVVVYETVSITVTPTAAGTNSTVTVNGTTVASGQPSNEIDLVVGDNEISILVTAEDGTSTETYTVTVTRNIELNHNANLSDLIISEGALSPVFDADQLNYSKRYDSKSAISSVTVTPTVEESSASITVNGATVASGQASAAITIDVGSNIINVTVTAEDIFTTKTYMINLCKAKIDLPKTGQTTCYDADGLVITCNGTGQDGDLQTGIEWPDPRFTDNGNTVTDNLTGLMWVKDANLMVTNNIGFDDDGTEDDGLVTWFHALEYALLLSSDSYEGFSDWRLPNNRELRSLVDYQYESPALPQGHPFTNVQNSYYWTSTTYYYDTSTPIAWGV